jgi:hypothetical protein
VWRIARLDVHRVDGDAPDVFWVLDGVSFEVRPGRGAGVLSSLEMSASP